MDKIKKYKKQIFTIITIFLLLEFGVFPCLSAANTFSNIIGGIALGVLILWGLLEVRDVYHREDEEERIFKEKWEAHIAKQMEAMKEMHEQNEALKKKNPKQFDGVESDKPFVKTRKKSTTKPKTK